LVPARRVTSAIVRQAIGGLPPPLKNRGFAVV